MRNFPISLRWMLAGVVVGAASLGALWLKSRGTHEELRVTGGEVVEEKPGPSVGEAFETELQSGTAQSRVAMEERVPIVPSRPARPGDGRSLRGRVEFVGLEPEQLVMRDSSSRAPEIYVLFVGVGGEREGVSEELDGREWSCELPFVPEDIARVQVAGVVWRERLWRAVAGSETLPLDFSAEAVVQLERAPVTTIRVFDAKTREPIERFRVAFGPPGTSPTTGWLANEKWQDFKARRLDLHPREAWGIWPGEPFTAKVSAPGHGVVAVGVELGSGVAHEVLLPLGGSATLRWQPENAASQIGTVDWADTIRLTVERLGTGIEKDSSPVARSEALHWSDFRPELTFEDTELPPRNPELERLVDGLAAGSYRARLEHESGSLLGITRVAEAQFSLKAGQHVEVQLRDVVDPEAVNVPLALEFAFPVGSAPPAGERVWLSRFNADDWGSREQLQLVRGTWQTQPVVVRPGRYRASVRGLRNFELEFEFPPQSVSPVVLPVPTLHHFRIQLASTSRDTAATKERVRWRSEASRVEQEARRASGDPETSEFYTDTLPVMVSLSGSRRFDLIGGPALELAHPGEHRLTCIEKPRLRLRFLTEGDSQSVPLHMKVHFGRSPDGARFALQERHREDSLLPTELRVWFPQAGEYELEFKELADFEPLPPLSINIGARHDQLIELRLVRKR